MMGHRLYLTVRFMTAMWVWIPISFMLYADNPPPARVVPPTLWREYHPADVDALPVFGHRQTPDEITEENFRDRTSNRFAGWTVTLIVAIGPLLTLVAGRRWWGWVTEGEQDAPAPNFMHAPSR